MLKMYTAKWCSDCRRAKEFLKERNISYKEVDIEENPGAVDIIIQARGKRVLPTLELKDRFMDGNHFQREKFEADLREIGVLE